MIKLAVTSHEHVSCLGLSCMYVLRIGDTLQVSRIDER